MTQPTINSDETTEGNLTAPKAAVVLPATAHTLQDRGTQRCALGSTPWDLRMHLVLGRHPICAGTTTQALISLTTGESEFYAGVRGACSTLGLAALMLDLGFRTQAEPRTDSTAAKGLASRPGARQVRHIHCPALWLQQVITRWKIRTEKEAVSTLSAEVGTKTGIPAQKLWELPTRRGCHKSAERADVALEIVWCYGLVWPRRTQEVANMLRNHLGCEHAEGPSQVLDVDELTLLHLSDTERFLCTEFHDDLNTRILAAQSRSRASWIAG